MSTQSTVITSVTPKILSIVLRWNKLPGVPSRSFFTIQYSTNSGSSWTTFPTPPGRINGTVTTTTISSLNPNLFYIFRIAVTNTFGIGPYSPQTSPVKPLTVTPSVPVNVTALNNINSILVNWKSPTNIGATPISEYKIEYSSNSGSSWTPITGISSNIFSYTISGLSNGTTYLCRISAKNQNGWSPTTSPISVLVFAPPSPPTSFVGSPASGGGAALVNWTPPTNNGGKNIVEYAIRCAGFKTLAEAQKYIPTPQNITPFELSRRRFNNTNNINSFTVSNLTNGLYYALTIRAFNVFGSEKYNIPDGSSVWSNKIIIRPTSVPGSPTNMQITGLGNSSVSISWTAPTNTGGLNIPILYYLIQYNDGSNWITYASITSNTSMTVENLTVGQSYVFRVAAVNNIGTSSYSDNSIPVVPGSPPPDAPSNVQGVSKNKSVLLSWDAPVNTGGLPILNYTIQQSSNNGASWSLSNNGSAVASNSVLITGLTNGTSYKFRVSATNLIGSSPYSSASSSVTPQPTVPQKPTNLKAEPLDSKAVLNWKQPSDNGGSTIISYKIQKSTNSGSIWTDVATINSDKISYIVDNLTNNTSYIFKVAAINSVGTGPYSDNSNVVTPKTPPILFDNSQLDEILQFHADYNNITAISPWKEYILEATNRLSKYIKYDDTVVQAIRNFYGAEWSGAFPIYIDFHYEEDGPFVAYAGIDSFAQVYGLPGVKANTISYVMGVNTFYQNRYNHSNWVDIFAHELCHALGLGVYWNYEYSTLSGGVRPINHLLNGTAYSQTQTAYNSITGLSRTKTPLENRGAAQGNITTVDSHWEDGLRLQQSTEPFYYGVWDELMIGYAPEPNEKRVLSRLTLKHLVDLGYTEINPGASEGDPEVNSTRIYDVDHTQSRMRMNCMCKETNLPIPKNLGTININTGETIV